MNQSFISLRLQQASKPAILPVPLRVACYPPPCRISVTKPAFRPRLVGDRLQVWETQKAVLHRVFRA